MEKLFTKIGTDPRTLISVYLLKRAENYCSDFYYVMQGICYPGVGFS